jgi:predicted Zn-dependent peptidase
MKVRNKIQSPPPLVSLKFFEEKQDAVQSAIRIGKRFVNKKHPDYNKLKVLNMIYGGYFGSRLMSNLREEKGFCYGIYSVMASFTEDAYLCTATEVGAHTTTEAVKEIYVEMERLRNELVPEDELQTVKNFMMGSLLADVDGAFNVSDVLRGLIVYDLQENFFYKNIEELRSVTSIELRELAHKYYDPETMIEVVVGKLPAAKAGK